MGFWLGFQTPSPLDLANAADPGDPGWFIRLRPHPSGDGETHSVVACPTAHAVFRSPDEALEYVAHPGVTPLLACYYLGYWQARGKL